MATIVTRAAKGSPLTSAELDQNQINLNTDKAELSGATFTGEIVAPSLDISGNIDVDGVTNLDVVDIDGAVDMASTLQVDGAITSSSPAVITTTDFGVELNTGTAGDGSLKIGHFSNGSFIGSYGDDGGVADNLRFGTHSGDVRLTIASNGTSTFAGEVVAASLTVDNFTLDGNTLALSSGDFTLDAANNIFLDTDGGVINLKDGGTSYGQLIKSSNDFRIFNPIPDGDLVFRGNDGGSTITALTLDMSAAGAATFASTIAATSATFTASTASMSLVKPGQGNFSLSFDGSNSNIASNSSGATINLQPSSTTRMSLAVGGSLTTFPLADKPAVFNENGIDADFRVESNSDANCLFVDAGNDLVMVGNTASTQGEDYLRFDARPGNSGHIIISGRDDTSTKNHHVFVNPNGAVGSIQTSGSGTAYNTSSDQRLKENIADADDAGSKIDAIQVRKFDWKADGEHQDYGMVAQELNEIAPKAVSQGEKEDEMWAVDYSKLVPMLIKEIQSLRQRVASLEE